MKKKFNLCFLSSFIIFLSSFFTGQNNHPPQVVFLSPADNSSWPVNGQPAWSVQVKDEEDGDSKFDEVNPLELLVHVQFFPGGKDQSKINAAEKKLEPEGLQWMISSNCFNCHRFSEKSIGPSFIDLKEKYAVNDINLSSLAKHIHEGSSGTWGKVVMPSHPEFSEADCRKMARWMIETAAEKNQEWLVGISGTVRMDNINPRKMKGVLLLTASYLDHGVKDAPKVPRLSGSAMIKMRIE